MALDHPFKVARSIGIAARLKKVGKRKNANLLENIQTIVNTITR